MFVEVFLSLAPFSSYLPFTELTPITLVLGSPEVHPALQLWSHQCHVERWHHLPQASSKTPPDIAPHTIDLLCHKVILLLRVKLVSTSTPRPFPGELLSSSQPLLYTFPPHTQDFTLPIPEDPAHPSLPLDGSTTYCCINIYSTWARQAGQAQRSWPGPTGSTGDQTKFPGGCRSKVKVGSQSAG